MTKPKRKRDWRTPLMLTLSVHLMAFTLVINLRLFQMLDPRPQGGYIMKISEVIGDDPDDEAQDDDAGAAAGDKADQPQPPQTSVADAFKALETAQVQPRPDREKPTVSENPQAAPTTDDRSLTERLQASLDAAGGGGVGDATVAVPGGGSHGLRGQGKHGIGLKRHGGSGETEDAVHMGLAWLAKVQNMDGRWDSDGFMLNYMPGATWQQRIDEGPGLARNDVSLTGLCVLAFTGAGYSDREGQYKQTLKRARDFLLSQQRVEDGGFGLESTGFSVTMYEHTLATFALTDLYLVSGDDTLRTPMRRALEYLLAMQGETGSWDYTQRYPSTRDEYKYSGREDLSITGWVVLTLVAAREAGFVIPPRNLELLASYLKRITRDDGDAVYANKAPRPGERGMAMLATSAVSRRLLGESVSSSLHQRQLERIAETPPNWNEAGVRGGATMYYWYYGSVALMLSKDANGGDDRWRAWNIALKRTLLDNQCKSGERRGSFDPVGFWAKHGGGRVYATALCVLNLEIYYRYEPEYLRVRASELKALWD